MCVCKIVKNSSLLSFLHPKDCQHQGSSRHKVTQGLLFCLSCTSPCKRDREMKCVGENKKTSAGFLSVWAFLSYVNLVLKWYLASWTSPPLMTMSDWWSSGLSSSATAVCFVTCRPLPFCLESSITAQSLEISTLSSKEGHLRRINTRFHNSRDSLIESTGFDAVVFLSFLLPTRTQAGDSVWFLEDGVAGKLFQHRNDH